MTDIFAFSFGDISPNLFLGENGDGNLGRNTQMHLVGCIDGREFGLILDIPNSRPSKSSRQDAFGVLWPK